MLSRSCLYGYQLRAVDFVKNTSACALTVDCGLGKTSIALTAYSDLVKSFDARRALVVAPLRVARKVWSDEVKEWAHLQGIEVATIVGTPAQRMKALRTPADVHTINREQLEWLHAQFIQNDKQITRWPWDIVFLDESQSFKSQSSNRWKAMLDLRKLTQRVVLLSGTIMPNGYPDLWSQYYLLDRGKRLGFTETAYHERWFERPTRNNEFDKWVVKPHAVAEIQAAIADITLSLRADDYLSLPPVVYNFIKVQLSAAAMRTYREMAREFISEVKGRTLTAVNAGVLDGKLLQLANGVVYVGKDKEVVEFHEEKLNALEELLDSIQGKLLIAYYYLHDLARIKALLAKSGRRWSVLRSDAEFASWANGEFDVGVLHPLSAGHGLNDVYKSGCEDIVHFGLTASLEAYVQVNDRLAGGHRRVGRNVKIHHIVAEGTRDMDYIQLLKNKATTQSDLTRNLARLV